MPGAFMTCMENLWQWCADPYAEYPLDDVIDPNHRFFESSSIFALIKKLGSPVYAERQSATAALKEIGVPTLFSLRATAKDPPDLETKLRAEQLEAIISERGRYFPLRGGSFSVTRWSVRSACRNYNEPWMRNYNYGIRVVMSLNTATTK
jgi:formylglycine-generating enzyme required for sulfatase activity